MADKERNIFDTLNPIVEGFDSLKELNPVELGVDKRFVESLKQLPQNYVNFNLPMKEADMKELSKNFLQLEMQGLTLERIEKKLMQILQLPINQGFNSIIVELQKRITIYESELKHIKLIVNKDEVDQTPEKTNLNSERSSTSSTTEWSEQLTNSSASVGNNSKNINSNQPQSKRVGIFSLQKSMIPIKKKEEICFPVLQNTLKIVDKSILMSIDHLADEIIYGPTPVSGQAIPPEISLAYEWLKNEIYKLDQVINFFPKLVKLDNGDMFCNPSESQQWRELELITLKKEFTSKQSIEDGLRRFLVNLKIAHDALKRNIEEEHYNDLFQGFQGDFYTIEYNEPTANSLEKECVKATNIFALFPGYRKRAKELLPSVLFERNIYVTAEYEKITKEQIVREYSEGTIRKLDSSKALPIKAKTANVNPQDELFYKSKEKIKIRIFSVFEYKLKEKPSLIKSESLTILPPSKENQTKTSWISGFFSCCGPREKILEKNEVFDKGRSKGINDNIIIHFHGGCFVGGSSSSHQSFLRRWALKSKCPIFSVNYKLAPEYPYPTALDECWQAYNWIISHYENDFQRKLKKVIVIGDGAGANLALGVCFLAAKKNLRIPDGLLLFYPILNLDLTKISPSYLLSIQDQLYSSQATRASIRSYLDDPRLKCQEDPFISPMFAPNEFLLSLPTCSLVVGDSDPNYHDCIKFTKRLDDLSKDIRLITYANLPHGFLNYAVPYGVPELEKYIDDTSKVLNELVLRIQIT